MAVYWKIFDSLKALFLHVFIDNDLLFIFKTKNPKALQCSDETPFPVN